MNRRMFLTAAAGLPFLGFLKPAPVVKVTNTATEADALAPLRPLLEKLVANHREAQARIDRLIAEKFRDA